MALSSKDKARLYHDLGTMLQSGFHLDRGIELLLGQKPSAGRRAWLEGLKQGLAGGSGVAQALERRPSGSSALELRLLAAGEHGGRLGEACAHLAKYFELRHQSVSKAVGALIYPLIIVHFAILVPDLSKVVTGGLHSGFSGIPGRLLVLWGLIGLVAFLAKSLLQAATRSVAADRVLRMVPLAGGVVRHWALARFSQVMHIGLLAAMKVSDSVRLAGGASQSAVLEAGARDAAAQIEHGRNLSDSIRTAGGFPVQFTNSMEMAEQSGTLDRELERWAGAEAQLAARAQDRAAEWMPRIFYALVVLYVAARIFGMFAGYFEALRGPLEQLDRSLHH
jgi:type II secretory pathway component PulF